MAKRRNHLRVVTGDVPVTDRVESQPSVRAQVCWTAWGLQTVERSADAGDMFRLGDLVDQILADERIGELLDTLASLALGCELSFEKGPGESLGDGPHAAELQEDYREGWPREELALFIIYTHLAGFAFARHEGWFNAPSGRMVPRFRAWHPKHFRWDQQRHTWLWRDQMGNETSFTPGDGEWVASYRRGEFRPWAQGLWRGLARWWLLKQYAISDWGVHSEKASKLVLTAAEGVEPETRRALADDILRAAKDTIISLPVGFNMQLIELGADTERIYLAQIHAAEENAAIAILGQNLSTKVEGGSFAAAAVHAQKENRKVSYAAQACGLALQRQSLPFWVKYNFGGTDTPFPRYDTDPPEDKTEKVGTLATLATALVTLKQAGFKLSAELIEKDYGFKLEAMSPAELAAQQPSIPNTGSAAGGGSTTPKPRAPIGSVKNEYEQPRVPAGNPHGGEFAPKDGGWGHRGWSDRKPAPANDTQQPTAADGLEQRLRAAGWPSTVEDYYAARDALGAEPFDHMREAVRWLDERAS